MGIIRATSFACILGVCFGAVVYAGDSDLASLRPEVREAITQLQNQNPAVSAMVGNGHVKRLYGTTLQEGSSPSEAANGFVSEYAQALGVAEADLMPVGTLRSGDFSLPIMPDSETGNPRYYLMTYSQHVDGVPVFGGELRVLVRNTDNYPVVQASSTLKSVQEMRLPSVTALSQEAVKNAVREDRANLAAANYEWSDFQGISMESIDPALSRYSDHELVIWAGLEKKAEPRLAVSFISDNYGNPDAVRPERWKMVADYETGEILHIENMIHFTNITGSVRGYATQGVKAWECQPETMQVMPYIDVHVNGGASTYTDSLGSFELDHSGTGMVMVKTTPVGQYFYVENFVGDVEELQMPIVPPGPAAFVYNEDNNDEQLWAQTNTYVSANAIRNFVLSSCPSYPTISTEVDFPIVVNRNDYYCPGNAWYDGSSINFCQSGSNNPNTAFGSVLHHEYGHHVVGCGGSGQDEYGEGIADAVAFLYANDPGLGYGFYTGQCDTPLRNAENDCQYLQYGCSTCGSEVHDCGQLLAGAIWSVLMEMQATNPFDYRDIVSSLTINSVMLHGYSTSIGQDIVVDFLTLDDNDGDIYNGTPHAAEICAGFGAHALADVCEDINFAPLAITYPDGTPDMIPPGQEASFTMQISGLSQSPNYRTAKVKYRVDAGQWVNAAMTNLGNGLFQTHLPVLSCGSQLEWYAQCDANDGTTVYDPSGAPGDAYTSMVASGVSILFQDDFESSQGWTTSGNAVEGGWERGVPVDNNRGDPQTDYDGSGQCFLTENDPYDDNSDIDDGYVYLVSPAIDLSQGDATISYALWYTNDFGDDPNNDTFKIYVSNNNGNNWTLVETVGPQSTTGWNLHEFSVSEYVTPTSQVKVRFEASDLYSGSVVEAGIDAFEVSVVECNAQDDGDLDEDGDVDLYDFSLFQQCYAGGGSCTVDADLNNDGTIDLDDWAVMESLMVGP